MRRITRLVLHWMGPGTWVHLTGNKLVETVRGWHLDKGWSDIGYHYLIDSAGRELPGRPDYKPGAHAYGHNQDTLGILFGLGDKDVRVPPAMLDTGARLVKDLCDFYGVPLSRKHVLGHRDLMATECPGVIYPHIKEMVERWRR